MAGTETTTCLIANLLHELMVDRSRWERVKRDPGLIANAVEESLRRDTPLQSTMRTPQQSTEITGCPVRHGEQLVLHLQSANWDETEGGPDAAEFDLHRPMATAHLAFGKGTHACLGAPMARMETRVLLEELLDRFRALDLAEGYRWTPTLELVMRRPASLDLVVDGHSSVILSSVPAAPGRTASWARQAPYRVARDAARKGRAAGTRRHRRAAPRQPGRRAQDQGQGWQGPPRSCRPSAAVRPGAAASPMPGRFCGTAGRSGQHRRGAPSAAQEAGRVAARA